MKREFKDRLIVKGWLPVYAHLDIPSDTPTNVYSTHTPTVRGVKAALRQIGILASEYDETHGNRAAFRLWVELNGQELDRDALKLMVDDTWDGIDGLLKNYARTRRIMNEVAEEMQKQTEELENNG